MDKFSHHNRNLGSRRQARILLLLLVFTLTFPSSAWSQQAIESLVITNMDTTNFPTIRLQVLARDASGRQLQDLPIEALSITENGEQQTITSVEPVDGGVRLAVVIDPGDGSFVTGVTLTEIHRKVLEDMEQFAVGRPWMIEGTDEVIMLSQEGTTTFTIAEKTSAPMTLMHSLTSYVPPVGAAVEAPNHGDYTRAALLAGLKELRLSRPGYTDLAEAVLLYTPGMRADLTDVAEEAIALGIPIHIIFMRTNLILYWSDALRPLAEVTGGEFHVFTAQSADPEPLFDSITSTRTQHIITYETRLAASAEREVMLTTPGGVTTTAQYTIDLQPPQVEIVAPLEDSISRTALSSDQGAVDAEPLFATIAADVFWPDGRPREITQARLLVNGVASGQAQVTGDQIEIAWDLRTYANKETLLVSLEVEVVDAFGFQAKSLPRSIGIRYVPLEAGSEPDAPLSQDILLYVIGGVALLSLGLAFFLFFSRLRLGPALQEAREGFVDFVERVTGKRTAMIARAVLVPVEGFDALPNKSYEIYGTTAIGRSRRHADLLFHIGEEDSPISRLHCTILDEDDHFSIRDEDSSNGTYVNDGKLGALMPARLKDGDIVDLAPLERGGLRFSFQLAEDFDFFIQPSDEIRMTRPGRQIRN